MRSGGEPSKLTSVSDDEETHGRVASALERSGFRPAVRSNWREAAQRIGSVRPDLIVADVRRPETGRDARKLLEQRGLDNIGEAADV